MASAGTSRRRNAREARNHATNCESTTVEATTKSFLPTPSPLNFFKGHKRGDDENDENDHNIHEKKKRKRHSSSSSWQIHQNYAPLSILLMTVLVLLAVSYLQRVNSTPGLYTPPIHKFIPAPLNKRRTACVDVEQKSVIRAFEMRNWNVVILKRKSKDPKLHVLHCYQQGSASIVWTKLIPRYWNASQPWQRQNQIPFERDMSRKAQTTEMLRQHAKQRNRPLPDFIPESYVLPNDKDALLKRLTIGPKALLRGAVPDHLEGRDDPWVLKLSAIDNGIGIAMLGPGSDELKLLINILRQADPQNVTEYMNLIRRKLVAEQKGDTRKESDVELALNRTERLHDRILVQRYICGELDYQGRKFDLRVYYLVASVDPLVVYAHDGYLRVSPHAYDEGKFSNTADHLTNLGRNEMSENNTISYEQWETELHALVASDPSRYPWSVRRNPLQHIRNQIKSALAELVAATRRHAFRGMRSYTNMENGFALMGADFIVDRDLNVWFTEGQDSPGLLHETDMKRKLNDRLLPATVDIVEEITEKQYAGLPLFPIQKTGEFELIYTDDFQYTYQIERKLLLGPCKHS